LVVALDLRPPVNDLRVLDRQLMQPEGLSYPGQLIRVRVERPQSHKAALAAPGRRLLQRHAALPLPEAVLVVSTINDHLGNSLLNNGRHPLPSMTESGTVRKIVREAELARYPIGEA
jgi:hypothetical protein